MYGYDPARVDALHRLTREAVDALAAIRSDDGAAADAMRAVARARETLEQGWIPFIDAIVTSTAMTAWRQTLGADPFSHAFGGGAPTPAGWIGTNGLDHWSDTAVIDQLLEMTDRVRRSDASLSSSEQAEQNLAIFAGEAVRRARYDRSRFATAMEARLGEWGIADILGAIDALAATARFYPDRQSTRPAQLHLAELLGPLSKSAPVADTISWHLANRGSLGPLIAETYRAWDPTVLVALTTDLVRAIHEGEYVEFSGSPVPLTASGRADNVGALAEALAHYPAAALALLGDDRALELLATDPHIADSSAEAIMTAALLGAPRTAIGDGLEVVSRLVAITDDDKLNDGTKRGLAASMLRFFPLLAPQLDVRMPIVVPYGTDPGDAVEIGRYCDLQRLFGQLLSDDTAQLVLGAMTERYRVAETSGLASAIRARPGDDAAEHRARIAAALADSSAIDALVLRSRNAQSSLAAYEHGVVVGRAKSVVEWAGMISSFAIPSSSTVLRIAIPIASEVVTEALDLIEPAELKDLGIGSTSAIGFTVAVIGLPTRRQAVRTELGLASVPAATWQRLDDLLEELADTDDHDRRVEIHARIVQIASADPDLDLYVTQIESLSGDAANAGPQPPASCS